MNNSSISEGEKADSSPLLILSVNISMFVVVLAFLSHISAILILFRSALRKKIMSPFMINLSVICLVVSAGDYAVTLGTDFKKETENNTKTIFPCNWVAFVGLLSKAAYSSTLCAMNIVSNLAADRCSRGVHQQSTTTCIIIVFSASWLYSVLLSGILLFDNSLSALSASQLTCRLNWSSQEKLHFVYNAIVVTMTMLLPMVICFAMQCHCARIWKNSRHIQNTTRRRGLEYRRKLNRMVIALTLVFFLFELPYQVGNVVAMTTGYYSYTDRVAFVLEILVQANVLHSPWIYLFLNVRYRIALKRILTGSSGQTTSGSSGNAPRKNHRQGGAAATNRYPERAKRVKFANNKVDPALPRPVSPTTKRTNGSTSLTSKTMESSSRNETNASSSTDGTKDSNERTSEQSTDHSV